MCWQSFMTGMAALAIIEVSIVVAIVLVCIYFDAFEKGDETEFGYSESGEENNDAK